MAISDYCMHSVGKMAEGIHCIETPG